MSSRRNRPGCFVGTLAYQFSRTPPRSLKPHPNVAIQLCSIEACLIHPLNDPGCPRNAAFCKDLEGWCRICEHVYVWNYNTNFACYNSPCPNLDVIGPNVRFLAAHGVNGIFMQAAGNRRTPSSVELRNYLISRLLWDPTLDDHKLIDEFVCFALWPGGRQGPLLPVLDRRNRPAFGNPQSCFGSAASYGIDAAVAREGDGTSGRGNGAGGERRGQAACREGVDRSPDRPDRSICPVGTPA